ncbi:MAG: DUF6599 family protein [Planctomycetota bacterium]|jgi:hypothetical protein
MKTLENRCPNQGRSILFASLFLIACLFAACAPPEQEGGLPPPIPHNGFPAEEGKRWTKVKKVKRFTGADLYGYINGGAEVFLELGFKKLEVHRYTLGPAVIDLECYEMNDRPGGLGVYLLHCGQEESVPELDDLEEKVPHTGNPYQIQFCKGRFYVKINNTKDEDEAAKSLPDFASWVARWLQSVPMKGFFDPLPKKDRIPDTERVIRGPFTLERVYTLGKGDILMLGDKATALAADYMGAGGDTISRIVALYPDRTWCSAAFDHLNKNLDPYLEVKRREDARLVFKDYAGKYGDVRIDGKRMLFTLNLPDEPLLPSF